MGGRWWVAIGLAAGLLARPFHAQEFELRGELSLSLVASDAADVDRQALLRYLPEITAHQEIGKDLTLDLDIAANAFATGQWANGEEVARDEDADLYRGWIRLAGPRLEARAGLQKISFGSATVFRPLMWFDRVDPRDPLQFTEGVTALLLRYVAPGDANLWAWGVLGTGDTKGWEAAPTPRDEIEFGGRAQLPLGPGELALSYHRREADLGSLAPLPVPGVDPLATEERVGLDGKWDVGPGVWFEGAVTRQRGDLADGDWHPSYCLGADYTFGVGNGLTVLTEHFVLSSAAPVGAPEPDDLRISSLSASYPLGTVDMVTAALYWDWQNDDSYTLIEWRRTRDRWRLHLIAFANPDRPPLFPSQGQVSSLAGTGVEAVFVFNH